MNKYQFENVSKNTNVWYLDGNDIHEAKILDCDFNKYCTIKLIETSEKLDVKWSYLFPTYLSAALEEIWHHELELGNDLSVKGRCINPWKMLLNNKDYAQWKKLDRKSEPETYVVITGERRYDLKTLKKALKLFNDKVKEKTSDVDLFSVNEGALCYYSLDGDFMTIYHSDKTKRNRIKHWRV